MIWRFSGFYKVNHGKWFTTIVIWIFFPINIITAMLSIENIEYMVLIGVGLLSTLIHLVSYISIYFILKLRAKTDAHATRKSMGSQAFTATFPNALIYAFPILLATVGEEGLFYASFFIFFNMILRNSLGVLIGIQYSNSDDENTAKLNIKG